MSATIHRFILSIFALLALVVQGSASAIIQTVQGPTPASIQTEINQFFSILGGVDNGTGGSFITGRRELDLGLVPDNFAEPNGFPGDFFRTTVPRGATLSSGCRYGVLTVSADAVNPTGTPVAFGNIDPSYLGQFITYDSQRVMAMKWLGSGFKDCSSILINFSIPGTDIPATVSGVGLVFTDTDTGTNTLVRFYDVNGNQIIGNFGLRSNNNGLSFLGVNFNAGERIASVEIWPGAVPLFSGGLDGPDYTVDRVAISAIFYGEPRAATFHTGDFDGDGITDSTVFRPSTAGWFTLNSGTNTVSTNTFGLSGDIPVDGDFDGDRRADLCVFRPSTGVWFFQRSSNGTTLGAQFGQAGDKPVVGDYDKDGISDIAVWRPSTGNYLILRSSSNFSTFFGYPFGQNGDIPVQGGAQ
jgi:FG-GAP-like repeat